MNLEWRLINLEKKEGLFNTMIDLAVFKEVVQGNSKPTFIFSEWEPSITLGVSQSYLFDVDKDACQKNGVKVVRRKSGGQSVYLDDGYIVFSAIAPRGFFANDLSELRKDFCEVGVVVLRENGIPAEFYEPDNIIVRENGRYKTIGSSGQFISQGGVLIKSLIRYKLRNFNRMIDVLKVNGLKLNPYKDEIKEVLADVQSYNSKISKEYLKKKLAEYFSRKYRISLREGSLADEEFICVSTLMSKHEKQLEDKEHYKSRGVCYLYLNGFPLVESFKQILPYNEPSGIGSEITEARA